MGHHFQSEFSKMNVAKDVETRASRQTVMEQANQLMGEELGKFEMGKEMSGGKARLMSS